MQTKGSCFCGAITLRAEIDPARVVICHCRDCQILGGSAFRVTTPVARDDLELLTGERAIFEKVAESGRVRRQVFCPRCGTNICSLPPEGDSGGFISLRVSILDIADQLEPRAQIWCRSRLSWLPEIDTDLRFDCQP